MLSELIFLFLFICSLRALTIDQWVDCSMINMSSLANFVLDQWRIIHHCLLPNYLQILFLFVPMHMSNVESANQCLICCQTLFMLLTLLLTVSVTIKVNINSRWLQWLMGTFILNLPYLTKFNFVLLSVPSVSLEIWGGRSVCDHLN